MKVGDSFKDCADCPEMVVVPAGSFTMGSPPGEAELTDNERPQHKVTIAKPFAVGKFEVTFVEWDACVAAGGCKHRPNDEGWGRGTRPAINVSWSDITKEFLPWLSRTTRKTYRLLSEAEWEYAGRAGSAGKYNWGDDIGTNRANCNRCGSQWDAKQTAPVGSFRGNAFGLYDMHGNVAEWVVDCLQDFDSNNYTRAPPDGSARSSGKCVGRILRGGSWFSLLSHVRSAARNGFTPGSRNNEYGFRVARML